MKSRILTPKYSIIAALLVSATLAFAQTVPVVTGDARVDKLLSQMTLQEKLTLIHGTHEDPAVYQGQAATSAAFPAQHSGVAFCRRTARSADPSPVAGRNRNPWVWPQPSAARPLKTTDWSLAAKTAPWASTSACNPSSTSTATWSSAAATTPSARTPFLPPRCSCGGQGHPIAARHGTNQALCGLRL